MSSNTKHQIHQTFFSSQLLHDIHNETSNLPCLHIYLFYSRVSLHSREVRYQSLAVRMNKEKKTVLPIQCIKKSESVLHHVESWVVLCFETTYHTISINVTCNLPFMCRWKVYLSSLFIQLLNCRSMPLENTQNVTRQVETFFFRHTMGRVTSTFSQFDQSVWGEVILKPVTNSDAI